MDRQLVERIILEELEALDEGFFDDLRDRLKKVEKAGQTTSTSNLFKRYMAVRKGKKIIADKEKAEKLMLALGSDDLPPNLVTDKPIPLDITNKPVLLDPTTQHQIFGFVWNYDVPDGKKPKKFKSGNAAGAKLFYDNKCALNLTMYCRENWFRVEQEAEKVQNDPEATIVDPEPETETEPETEPTGGGSDLPVPVFKKFTGKERDQLGMDKSSAGSLSSQLQKLFPNVPKAVITQMLKDVAGQLKTNGVTIQEAKHVVAEEFYKSLSVMNEAFRSPVQAKSKIRQLAQVAFKEEDSRKKLANLTKFVDAMEKGVQQGDLSELGASVDGAPDAAMASFADLSDEHKKVVLEYAKNYAEKIRKGVLPKIKMSDAVGGVKGDLFEKFKEIMLRLDLNTKKGRKAALNDDQAYLGAFRFFKAMRTTLDAIEDGKFESRIDRLFKLVEPLNEDEREGKGLLKKKRVKEFKAFLEKSINSFEKSGLTDRKRAMQAMKAARQSKTGKPKDITRPQEGETPEDVVKRVAAAVKGGKATKADLERAREAAKAAGAETSRRTGAEGTVNTKQVVGSRLKQGGIDINSPEGKKLQNRIQKVIRRFLRKNLKRVGKDVNLIAERQMEEKIVEHVTRYILERNLTHKGES